MITTTYETIELVKLKKQQRKSRYTEGKYTIARFLDDKGRIMKAMGRWTENWKKGDMVKGNVIETIEIDRNGEHSKPTYYLENSNKKYSE